MASIEFCYNGNNILIQCNINDKMREIIGKYILLNFIFLFYLHYFYK